MIDSKSTDIGVEKFSLFYKGASQSMYRERVDCFIFIAHFVFMYLDKANYAWKKTIALQSHNKALLLLPSVSLGGTLFFWSFLFIGTLSESDVSLIETDWSFQSFILI